MSKKDKGKGKEKERDREACVSTISLAKIKLLLKEFNESKPMKKKANIRLSREVKIEMQRWHRNEKNLKLIIKIFTIAMFRCTADAGTNVTLNDISLAKALLFE